MSLFKVFNLEIIYIYIYIYIYKTNMKQLYLTLTNKLKEKRQGKFFVGEKILLFFLKDDVGHYFCFLKTLSLC